ncbi:GspH/FimT family pseudopilin [Stenotrophomonas sp. LGBM10]|uniref:GspH/FimT family pseudopilin n=1 Tax=Stenotrophomonas sp. LGBM10 TaxID=3390038 RepID=UPI00398B64C6
MRPDPGTPLRVGGVSLVQLLLTLALLGVLATLALPGLQGVLDRTRVDTVRMQLLSAFATARSTAISRRHAVSVCASNDGRQCGLDWSTGWLIYHDRRHQHQPATPDDVLHYQPGQRGRGIHATATSGRPTLRYDANGRSLGSNLTIALCVRGERRGDVIVNNTGRARSLMYRSSEPCP